MEGVDLGSRLPAVAAARAANRQDAESDSAPDRGRETETVPHRCLAFWVPDP